MRASLFIPALDAWLLAKNLGFLSAVINIVLAFVLARIAVLITSRVIRKFSQQRIGRLSQDDTAARRVETGMTLITGLCKYVFYFVAAAIAIGELGLSGAMTSMLAAAGIGTLAIGIGAKSLIEDITKGFFILFEDELAVGDYVTVANITGIVEAVSIRTVTIRGFRGDKNIIPNGQITTIVNYSRSDYYLALVDMEISHESDADRALSIMLEEMDAVRKDMDDPGIQPPEKVGIAQVTATGIVLRVTMQANVMQQWQIQREVIRRARLRFRQENIETPHERIVIVGGKS